MRIRGGTLLRLWACALLIVASNSMFAANWYVKLGGNNSNSGASWADAKASINAMVNSPNVGNGDIIFIEGGTYTEQVVIGNKSITLLGSQDAGAGISRTTIASPAYSSLTGYTFGTALSWNGAGKLSSNTIRPVVFVNASNSSTQVNIQKIDINGSGASMPEGSTEMLVGLAYRFARGTVGGSGENQVSIENFNATAESNGLNNAFGAMILTRSAVTFSHVIIENYRNAGIAVVGENLSSASSVIANQPNPTIIDCEVKGKTINSVSSGDFIQSGILIANGARATVKRTLVWQNRTNEANSISNRFAYGIYLNDARTVLIGETTTNKANGNLITDNEIGIYVRINTTAVSATGYTIRQNTIAYNGNETPSGKIASYGNETAQNTTYGAVRFNHVPITNQTLSVTNNAWGNSEAHLFFSANPTTADYTETSYTSNRVAFWNQDKGDQITFASPLSPLYGETLYVHQSNSPKNAVPGASNGTNGIGVNLEFGFFNFSQLNRAVYAAREQAGTGNTPNIYVKSNTTEDETAVITKSINIFGDSTACGSQSTIQLASSLNMPIVWAYGLNTQTTAPNNNSDAVTRTPSGITLKFLNFAPNNVQSSGSATPGTGPAMLVTGASGGTQTPIGVQLYGCAMSPVFDGSPLAISTDQDGSLTGRYAAHPVTIDAKFTKKTNNCDLLLVDNDVRDYRDDPILSLIMLDDIINITTNCADLQSAINNASLASPRTTIRVMTNLNCPVISANTTAKVRIETIAPFTLLIEAFNLNNGAGQGGNVAVCGMEVNTESSGITTIERVNVWPPACLHDAVNIVTDDPSHVVVAANSNAVVGALPFTESTVDTMNYVILQKRFDMFVATGATAINPSPASANQTFTGRFIIQDRLRHDGFVLGIADIPVVAGTMQSTRGLAFGDTTAQVELMHNRIASDLTNYNATFTPFYGGNIEMAQQFINDNSGSRRLNFYNSSFGTQNARIWKRVFANGLANRGTQTGIIRLDGSGNCTTSGPDASSVLRNLSIAQVDVANNAACIQTAIGRVISCDSSYQDLEGAGTNFTNGSGGTVNLPNVAFAQNVEIAKSITINEGTATTTGAVTLRRGAIVSGSIDEFTNTVNMNQCYSAHSNGANPDPQDAIKVASSSPSSVINIAGYGNTNPLGQGSQARGVWQFSNINVTKNVDFKGFYHSTSATNLSDCAVLASTAMPDVPNTRDMLLETVIGTHDNTTYNIGGGQVFMITDNTIGATVSGLKFRNVVHGGAGPTTVVRLGNNTGDVSLLNNIIAGNIGSTAGLVHTFGTTNHSTITITGNHVVISQPSFFSAPITLDNFNDSFGPSVISENIVNVTGAVLGSYTALSNFNNNSPIGLQVTRNWFTGAPGNGLDLSFNTVDGLDGVTISQNNIRGNLRGITIINSSDLDPGTNNITINDNFINSNDRGIELQGNWNSVAINKLFVNQNDLSNNTFAGIYIDAITNNNGPSTGLFDLRFNYWGSDLGPVRGNHVAINPTYVQPDSIRVKGHVPFNHSTGSRIEENPARPNYGRFMIYPVAVTGIDGNSGTCGWQYQTMQAPVLRVNGAGDELLGMYDRITFARDNSNAHGYPATTGPRSGTDQIFIIAESSYGTTFGYNGSVESEDNGNYPIVFDEDPEPSVVRGINRPTIFTDESGSIAVASTFPRDFTIKDFISHVSTTTGNYTAISLANPYSNTVENNLMTSLVPTPNAFTGISISHNGANKFQTLVNNKIKLATNTRWPGGPVAAVSAPSTFMGIEVTSHGTNGSINFDRNDISVASATNTKSTGIFVNAVNLTNATSYISNNMIYGMAAVFGWAGRIQHWGTGIYVRKGENFRVEFNTIQGGNGIGSKGHDGITLDESGSASTTSMVIASNLISTIFPLNGINMTGAGARERGYGVKLFSSTGSGNIGGTEVWNNTFGSASSTSPGVASFYVGGTSGTVGTASSKVRFWDNFVFNSTESVNAAVQVATSQYSGAASSAYVTVEYTDFGSTNSALDNSMFLAIGTRGDGIGRNTNADNYSVDVFNNEIRTSEQTVAGSSTEVADGRPNAGANIRNIFGYGTGSTLNGSSTAGNGNSGNNTFTHASILTSEPNHANYNYYTSALSRTAKAVALNNPSTTPVTIERLIATPLAVAGWADTANTVELRENAGFSMGSAGLYYNESLTFPDRRILVSGPRTSASGYAELLPSGGGTGTIFTSNGRENKDIRGAIRMNAISAGMFGLVSLGAANKGDVYLQLDNVGADNAPVSFRYHGSTLGLQVAVTQLNNGLNKTVDIKAGMDDADDDGFAANTSTTRRTGVFRSGTATSQFLKETPEAITGANVLNVYPNPASGDVTVAFHIPVEGAVRVALYNALGEKVSDLREEYLSVDNYTTSFSGSNLPSGTYHVRLVHDLFTRTVPVTIIK